MVIIVLSQVLNTNHVSDYVKSNLSGSKFKICLGEHAPTLVGTHTYACVSVFSHATINLLPSSPPPPPELKILYETLVYKLVKFAINTTSKVLKWFL